MRKSLRLSNGDWRRAADDLVTLALEKSDDNVSIILCGIESAGQFWRSTKSTSLKTSESSSSLSPARPRLNSSGLSKLAGLLR